MLRKINFEMVVLFVLVILALTIITFVISNSANVFATSEIGKFVGVCHSSCSTSG